MRDVLEVGQATAAERQQAKEQAGRLAAAKLSERIDRLTDALLDGLVDRAEFVAKKEALRQERVALASHSTPSDADLRLAETEQALELANTALVRGDLLNRDEIVSLAKTLRSNFLVRDKTLEVRLGLAA